MQSPLDSEILSSRNLLFVVGVSILSVSGFFAFGRVHIVNSTVSAVLVLDALCFLYIFLNNRFFIFRTWYQVVYLFYLLLSLSMFLIDGGHLVDFLIAVKFIIYLILLFSLRRSGSQFFVFPFIKFFLVAVALKYSLSVFLGYNERPLLLRENNFELIFVLFCYFSLVFTNHATSFWHAIVLFIVALSGSKSAVLTYLLVTAFYYFRFYRPKFIILFSSLSVISFIYIASVVSTLNISIDRFAMANVFSREMLSSSVLEILWGHQFFRPLSQESCAALASYPGLFSHREDGSCFSIILHSFHLRAVYDFGIGGFVFIWFTVYELIKRLLSDGRAASSFFFILYINGFSVSSINSTFFIMSVILLHLVFTGYSNTNQYAAGVATAGESYGYK